MGKNMGNLVAGYATIWLVLFAYCYRLAHRLEVLRRHLEALRQHQRSPMRAANAPTATRVQG